MQMLHDPQPEVTSSENGSSTEGFADLLPLDPETEEISGTSESSLRVSFSGSSGGIGKS
jgi:hypothetical protein